MTSDLSRPDQNKQVLKRRHRSLLQFLEQVGEADLGVLTGELEASESTIRRDLQTLEAEGLLVRTFGGARLAPHQSLVQLIFGKRTLERLQEKRWVARVAAELVEPGMVVALDCGSTVWHLARALRGKGPLTIITAGLAPLEELADVNGMTIQLVGGRFKLENLSFVAADTVENVKQFNADIAFIGVDSLVPGEGAFADSRVGSEIGAALASCADRRVVVTDHTKFDSSAPYPILPPSQIDTVVTDAKLDKKTRVRFSKEPYKLIYGGED